MLSRFVLGFVKRTSMTPMLARSIANNNNKRRAEDLLQKKKQDETSPFKEGFDQSLKTHPTRDPHKDLHEKIKAQEKESMHETIDASLKEHTKSKDPHTTLLDKHKVEGGLEDTLHGTRGETISGRKQREIDDFNYRMQHQQDLQSKKKKPEDLLNKTRQQEASPQKEQMDASLKAQRPKENHTNLVDKMKQQEKSPYKEKLDASLKMEPTVDPYGDLLEKKKAEGIRDKLGVGANNEGTSRTQPRMNNREAESFADLNKKQEDLLAKTKQQETSPLKDTFQAALKTKATHEPAADMLEKHKFQDKEPLKDTYTATLHTDVTGDPHNTLLEKTKDERVLTDKLKARDKTEGMKMKEKTREAVKQNAKNQPETYAARESVPNEIKQRNQSAQNLGNTPHVLDRDENFARGNSRKSK